MKMLNMPILKTIQPNDFQAFVELWSKVYFYKNSEKYSNNIGLEKLENNNLIELYEWKNGMELSPKKDISFQNILLKIDQINKFKEDFDLDEFKREFGKMSAVWKIFLLHIIRPFKYPIYDQHIHRAYNFLQKNFARIDNTISNKDKENFYFNTYLPFINDYKDIELKKLDEAMFAFGRFLKQPNNQHLLEMI